MAETEIRKISRGFQITLPKFIRDKYELKEGDVIELIEQGDSIAIKRLNKGQRTLEKLMHILDKPVVSDPLANIDEDQIMKMVEEEIKDLRAQAQQAG